MANPLVAALCAGTVLSTVAWGDVNGAAGGAGPAVTNLGLVGVCRIPHDAMDLHTGGKGEPLESLGGMFSAMALVPGTVRLEGGAIVGELVLLPDRGFADGIVPYNPRFHTAKFKLLPAHGPSGSRAAAGAAPLAQDQLKIELTRTVLLQRPDGDDLLKTAAGPQAKWVDFLGADPGTGPFAAEWARGWPQPVVLPFIDPEGVVLVADSGKPGTFSSLFISEEYGPSVYQFSPSGKVTSVLERPRNALPLDRDPNPASAGWRPFFGTRSNPEFGRRSNRGMESLTQLPGGEVLVGMMQSPLMQDGGEEGSAVYTRIYTWSIKPGSPDFGALTGEYVTALPVYEIGKKGKKKSAPCSELLALSATHLLALERDNLGQGADDEEKPAYKRVNVIDLAGATNLLGTTWSGSPLEPKGGAEPRKAVGFGTGPLPQAVTAAASQPAVDLLDEAQLAKFGLRVMGSGTVDAGALSEKFEGLMLVPALDTPEPDDAYLFVGSDNDFKTPKVMMNGTVAGQSRFSIDTLVLVYHVKLSGGAQAAISSPPQMR